MSKTIPAKTQHLLTYTKIQVRKAHEELDIQMAKIPNVCSAGCSACCHQMVSIHSWEEELIGSYISTNMHAMTKKIVRKQLLEWWRYLKTILRPSSRQYPISNAEYQDLHQHMIQARIMCPFLVDNKCSIYQVRPAVCRSYVVTDEPQRCMIEPGRLGDERALEPFLELFGGESNILPVDRYFHSMKPLAFAMTGILKVPVASTPVLSICIGDITG